MPSYLKENFSIGSLVLPNNFIYAPIAGHTDQNFRTLVRKFHQGLIFCEMVNAEGLLHGNQATLDTLSFSPSHHPIGAQIFGVSPSSASEAVKILEERGFDLVDLNCGCPSKNVTKHQGGAALLKDPQKMEKILRAMVKSSSKIPITVKIRTGWDEDSIVVDEVVTRAIDAGVSAITVHARTKKQGYSGHADWKYIKRAKEIAGSTPIIGNGDIRSVADAYRMLEETHCDGIMMARGVLSIPWLGESLLLAAAGQDQSPWPFSKILALMIEHFSLILLEKSEKFAVMEMRKVGSYYLKGVAGAKAFRQVLMREQEPMVILSYFQELLENI